jgi:hypothetical protein
MRREGREGYSGPAEIHREGGDKLGDATVTLGSWVTIIDDEGTTGTRGWAGMVTGLPAGVLPGPLEVMVTVRTPDGREARARMLGSQLTGVGPPPFDTT